MEKKFVDAINEQIAFMLVGYKNTGKNDPQETARLCGMIDMLRLYTGKRYYYDENGLHEK